MLVTALLILGASYEAQACSRLAYVASEDRIVVGRSMDFVADTNTTFWAYPAGMKRSGSSIETNPFNWTSKYGSVSAVVYDRAQAEGVNEKGLTGSTLYLEDSDYGKRNDSLPSMWTGHWVQYFLDQYATVDEVAKAVCPEEGGSSPFQVLPTSLIPNVKSVMHLAYSDPTGDNIVMEYAKGALKCWHSTNYSVMTNEPSFDQQLDLNNYWGPLGPSFLPGTPRPADRFARLSYFNTQIPQTNDTATAVSYTAGMIRGVSVPITRELVHSPGASDVWPTYWRTYIDLKEMQLYYESAINPSIFRISLGDLDLSSKGTAKVLEVKQVPWLERVGDLTDKFVNATSAQCAESDTEC